MKWLPIAEVAPAALAGHIIRRALQHDEASRDVLNASGVAEEATAAVSMQQGCERALMELDVHWRQTDTAAAMARYRLYVQMERDVYQTMEDWLAQKEALAAEIRRDDIVPLSEATQAALPLLGGRGP